MRTHYRRWRRHRTNGDSLPWPLLLLAAVSLPVGFVIVLFLFVALSYYAGVTSGLTAPDDVIASHGGGAKIYDRNGILLYQFLDEERGYQEWVDLEGVSPWMIKATLATEDPTFYSNPGINFEGLLRAAFENFRPGEEFFQGSGGSSITQQLAKMLYFAPEERAERTVGRKLREMTIAFELTRRYDKDQILEWYLNEAPYGGTYIGVEAAARHYFSVPAKDLTLTQAAFLAGLPQSPARYDPLTHFDVAEMRQHQVLDLMYEHGFISFDELYLAKVDEVQLKPSPPPFLAPHFVMYVGDYIKSTLGEDALYHGGLEVWTTLDVFLNARANAKLEEHLQRHEASTGAHNGAVVIIEPATGQILAMVGSRDYFREDIQGQVNNALALNAPGSTLKPFTYVTAFMEGWGPDWPVIDTPINYQEEDGTVFTPRNPGRGQTYGVLPVKKALGNSLNIPAFKTILWIGVDKMVRTAKAMGITTLDGHVGPAVTLGGTDVTLLDLTYAYSVFANEGSMAGARTVLSLPPGNRQLDPVCVLQATDAHGNVLIDNTKPETLPVIGPHYAYMITSILSDDSNREMIFGRGSVLAIPGWQVAVKSGTSEPFKSNPEDPTKPTNDTWSVGYTRDVAVGVWIGNSDNSMMRNIYSTTIAGAAWHDIMLIALEGKTPHEFVRPDGLVEATVCVPSGIPVTGDIGCAAVSGLFAVDALERQSKDHWGGEEIAACPSCIPEQLTEWKRYLAQEYLRYFGVRYRSDYQTAPVQSRPPAVAPAPTAVPAPPQEAVPAAPAAPAEPPAPPPQEQPPTVEPAPTVEPVPTAALPTPADAEPTQEAPPGRPSRDRR
ncbi:MAG: transglycosylase domain-containing protein [Dehalococcoidia bacterium]|nr:transglycosylase domain-containing protein [Dehalococcoidia bacterium]